MNTKTLFKTDTKIEQLTNISSKLKEISEELDELAQGKVDYFADALNTTDSNKNTDALYEKIELANGFEAEAYRGLHNAFLYMEKLSQL